MLLNSLFKYFTGKVYIIVEGFFIEKFINICVNKNVMLNDIEVENGCVLSANVSISDYRKLRNICKKTKCKMKITKKKGLTFVLNKYRKRRYIVIFILIVCMLIIYADSLIWNIKVINSDDVELNYNILQAVDNMGIKKYTSKHIDKDFIANQLIIQIDNLSWVEISVKGVELDIDVRKRINKPDIVEDDEICNIVASKPGVIEKIICRNGKTIAQKGDFVDKGALLISGIIDSEYTDDMFVHSEGEIYARVWYSEKMQIPFKEEKTEYTGNEKIIYGINIKNIKFFFKKLSTNYEEYDTILNEKSLSVGKYKTNIKEYQYIYREKVTTIINRNTNEAIDYAISILKDRLNKNLNENNILVDERNIITNLTDGVQVELIYECIEQIGTNEKIN